MSRKLIVMVMALFVAVLIFGSVVASAEALTSLQVANKNQLKDSPIKWVVVKKAKKAAIKTFFTREYKKVKKLGYDRSSWDAAVKEMNYWFNFKKPKKGQAYMVPKPTVRALTDPSQYVAPTEMTPYQITKTNIIRLNDNGNTGGTIYGRTYKEFKNKLMNEPPGVNFKSLVDRGFNFNEAAVAVYLIKYNKKLLIWLPRSGSVQAMCPCTIVYSYQLDPDGDGVPN